MELHYIPFSTNTTNMAKEQHTHILQLPLSGGLTESVLLMK